MKFNIADNYFKLHHNTCIITGIFEESHLFPTTKKIDTISNGYIQSLLQRKILNGKIGQNILVYDIPNISNQPIIIVGCGKKHEFTSNQYRKIIHKIIISYKNSSFEKISIFLSELDIKNYENYWKTRQTIQIITDNLYTFNKFKKQDLHISRNIKEVTLHIHKNEQDIKNCEIAVKEELIISNGIKKAKDLSNMPPNFCNPKYFVNQSKKLFNNLSKVHLKIVDAIEMKKLGMNAYLAVGNGSYYPPEMPIIEYHGHTATDTSQNIKPIVLIGKGLTFDSGGISIKPSHKMDEMKYDMCGAAAVYAVMDIVIKLQLPLYIIGILGICENMISNSSLRPGDIITTLSGKTVEVLNTDAEGRLVLCDILTYVKRYDPEIVIDIATLTGACVIALGNHFSGLMSNNDQLSDELILASKQTKDHIWKLPLHEVFKKKLKSTCADMTNVGGSSGSVITAGCFLQEFATQYNWAHLDIAGTAWHSNNHNKNATGRPISLLSQFLINKSKNK